MIEYIITLTAATVGILTTVVGIFIRTERRFGRLEGRMASIESKFEPFWNLIRTNLGNLLTTNPNEEIIEQIQHIESLPLSDVKHIKAQLLDEMETIPVPNRTNIILVLWYVETVEHDKEAQE